MDVDAFKRVWRQRRASVRAYAEWEDRKCERNCGLCRCCVTISFNGSFFSIFRCFSLFIFARKESSIRLYQTKIWVHSGVLKALNSSQWVCQASQDVLTSERDGKEREKEIDWHYFSLWTMVCISWRISHGREDKTDNSKEYCSTSLVHLEIHWSRETGSVCAAVSKPLLWMNVRCVYLRNTCEIIRIHSPIQCSNTKRMARDDS